MPFLLWVVLWWEGRNRFRGLFGGRGFGWGFGEFDADFDGWSMGADEVSAADDEFAFVTAAGGFELGFGGADDGASALVGFDFEAVEAFAAEGEVEDFVFAFQGHGADAFGGAFDEGDFAHGEDEGAAVVAGDGDEFIAPAGFAVDDAVFGVEPHEEAAFDGGGFGEGVESEADGLSECGDCDHLGFGVFVVGDEAGLVGGGAQDDAVVVGHDADDPFAVDKVEKRLDGIAVASGGGDVGDAHGVGAPGVGEQNQGGACVSGQNPADGVVVAHADGGQIGVGFLAFDAAVARNHDPGILGNDVDFFGIGQGFDFDVDAGAACITVGAADVGEFFGDEFPAQFFAVEEFLEVCGQAAFFFELGADHFDFEPGQAVEFGFEDGFGLIVVDAEVLDELVGGVALAVGGADQADGGVEVAEDDFEAFQDVDAAQKLVEFVLGAFGDDFHAEIKEVAEHILEIDFGRRGHLRVVGGDQAGQVDVEAFFELGVLEQKGHGGFFVGAFFEFQHDADVVGRFVADVDDLWEFFGDDVVGDLLDERRFVHHVGDRGDDDLAFAAVFFEFPFGAGDQSTRAFGVNLAEFFGGVEEHAAGGEVGAFDVIADDITDLQCGLLDESDEGVEDLGQVVRRYVGRHADGDAGCAVDQQVGDLGGQDDGFKNSAVVVGAEGDGLFFDFVEQFRGQRGQARFGVSHGGCAVAVYGAEVSLAVDEHVAQGEVLGHADHRVVNRLIAVRMVFTHDFTDDGSTFAIARVVGESQIGEHCVQDASLHGF